MIFKYVFKMCPVFLRKVRVVCQTKVNEIWYVAITIPTQQNIFQRYVIDRYAISVH